MLSAMRLLVPIVALSFSLPMGQLGHANGAVSSTFYSRTVASEQGIEISIAPDREPVAVGEIRSWRLSGGTSELLDVGAVSLALPREGITLPIAAELIDAHWTLSDLQMNRAGVWVLDITFTTTAGDDRVVFKLAVGDRPFVVSSGPTPLQVDLIRTMALPLESEASHAEAIQAAELGHDLFFDHALSRSGEHACASCHIPALAFSDAKARSHPASRNAPSLIGIAHQRWFNRDGSKDSLWSQALGPLENDFEIDADRVTLLQKIANHPNYPEQYLAAFDITLPRALLNALNPASPLRSEVERARWSELPQPIRDTIDLHFSNLGKALAAYQRQLAAQPSAFDRYAHALATGDSDPQQHMSDKAINGLLLFISSRTSCLDCHTGRHFSNQRFHNIGTAPFYLPGADPGRRGGIDKLLSDPFNCKSRFATEHKACDHLDGVWRNEIPYLLNGAFLTPGLRNVARTGPWFHDGSAKSLMDVMQHYRSPPTSQTGRTEHELTALSLTDDEIRDIVAFMESLSSDAAPTKWMRPPASD